MFETKNVQGRWYALTFENNETEMETGETA